MKQKPLSPTEVVVPKESYSHFIKAINQYSDQDEDITDLPKREYNTDEVWAVDLSGLNLTFDKLAWICRSWVSKEHADDDLHYSKDDQNHVRNTSFTEAARPLIKWIAVNKHPHHTAIVTSTGAELLEGSESTGEIIEYLKD